MSKKLLIVDDSLELLEAMKMFLEKKGYTVKTISTSEELGPTIKSFKPDLIILDVFLHGADGRDICKELRKYEDTKYLCIMMFSASPKALEDYKEYGADGCIEKPFGLNNIVEKIESVLETCKDYQY